MKTLKKKEKHFSLIIKETLIMSGKDTTFLQSLDLIEDLHHPFYL